MKNQINPFTNCSDLLSIEDNTCCFFYTVISLTKNTITERFAAKMKASDYPESLFNTIEVSLDDYNTDRKIINEMGQKLSDEIDSIEDERIAGVFINNSDCKRKMHTRFVSFTRNNKVKTKKESELVRGIFLTLYNKQHNYS